MNRDCVEKKVRREFEKGSHMIELLIDMVTDKVVEIYEDCEEGEPDIPKPLPRINSFKPVGNPHKIISGGDNGIIAIWAGLTYMAVGDVFVGSKKWETAIYVLSVGKDPRVARNWNFYRGTTGKTYGLTIVDGEVWSAQSAKGSGWEGTQNVRFWNVTKNTYSKFTLQEQIYKQGVNWFFVNRENTNGEVILGCLQDSPKHRSNEIKSPVRLYKGPINNTTKFKFLGIADDLVGRRRGYMVDCSITEVDNQWFTITGDWSVSIVDQFRADNLLGPYKFVWTTKFSPPMERVKSGGQYSGVFCGNIFYLNGKWWMILSGHRADLAPNDDSVWIVEIKGI